MARPYQSVMVNVRISGIRWVEGRSDIYARSNDTLRFYFGGGTDIYSDKLSRFISECNRATHGAVIRRREERFRRLYIDEIQDMAGYDIDLIELILRSKLQVILVGDHRQATFRTNNSPKNSAYSGVNIIDKFMEWRKDALCALSYQRETYRCNQKIADLADLFFPKEPKTISLNTESTGHDGVFCVRERDVAEYVERYRPQILRLDARTSCAGYRAMNFGDSKGLTFN